MKTSAQLFSKIILQLAAFSQLVITILLDITIIINITIIVIIITKIILQVAAFSTSQERRDVQVDIILIRV